MNQGTIRLLPYTYFISAEIIDGAGIVQSLDDYLLDDTGEEIQLFFGEFSGSGPGPTIPMSAVKGNPRFYEAVDFRLFEANDNRIFNA